MYCLVENKIFILVANFFLGVVKSLYKQILIVDHVIVNAKILLNLIPLKRCRPNPLFHRLWNFLVQIHPLVSRNALSSSLNLSRPSQPHNLINRLAPEPIPPSQFVLVSIELLISPCTAGCRLVVIILVFLYYTVCGFLNCSPLIEKLKAWI